MTAPAAEPVRPLPTRCAHTRPPVPVQVQYGPGRPPEIVAWLCPDCTEEMTVSPAYPEPTPPPEPRRVEVRIVSPVEELVRRSAFWRAWAVMTYALQVVAALALALAVVTLIAAAFLGHLLG